MTDTNPTAGAVFSPMTISDADFRRLANFVQSTYGIDLSQKRQLITGRLSVTIKQLGYKSFADFVDHLLKTRDEKEVTLLLNKLTTNYTFFMREQDHLDYFRDQIIPILETWFDHDVERIRHVLGDNGKTRQDTIFYQATPFRENLFRGDIPDDFDRERIIYQLNEDAFFNPASYITVYE